MNQPSTYAVWQKWAIILARSLERIAEIYEAHEEGAAAEQLKSFLERMKLFIDPVAHAQELAKQNYDVRGNISKLYVLATASLELMFREALGFMPRLSTDMQRLLNSPCFGNCNGRTASDVFKGPHGTENEGIGSGAPDDERGGLAWKLFRLVEEAEVSGDGYFERGLDFNNPGDAPPSSDGDDQPDRHEFHQKRRRITATGVQ